MMAVGIDTLSAPRRILCGIALVLACQTAARAEDLLKFLIEQNEAARQKIRSYSYTISLEWKDESKADQPALKGEGEVKRRGDYLWSKYRRTAFNKTAGEMQERELRVVVNDKYMASWPMVGGPLAYQDDHSSFDTIDPRIKTRIRIDTPFEVLPYCFGDTVRSFRESVNLHPEKTKWDAIEVNAPDGRLLYQIRRFVPIMNDASKPDMIWVVDPDRGFLATETISYKPDGKVWISRSIETTEAAEGVWFPLGYAENRYGGRGATDAQVLTEWRNGKLTHVRVNDEFPDEQFRIDALHLREDKPDIVVVRTGLDGRTVPYVYRQEGLIPQELAEIAQSAVDRTLSGIDSTMGPASSRQATVEAPGGDRQPQERRERPSGGAGDKGRRTWWIAVSVVCVLMALGAIGIGLARYSRKRLARQSNGDRGGTT